MKKLFRNLLINIVAIQATVEILPGFVYSGGYKTLFLGGLGLMLINLAVIPLLKIAFLPLNLLTLGIFTWIINVMGVYLLTHLIPQFKIIPFYFPGATFNGFVLPAYDLNILHVAILASFLVGFISHFLHWLVS